MTVEIRELIIRARVVNSGDRADASKAGDEADQTELVSACVEQVLKILERRRER
jgi:hypothetical protein